MKSIDTLARQLCLHVGMVVAMTSINDGNAKLYQEWLRQTEPYLNDVPRDFERVSEAAYGYARARGSRKLQAAADRLGYEVKRYLRHRMGNLVDEWQRATTDGEP